MEAQIRSKPVSISNNPLKLVASMLPPEAFSIIQKSFDARKMQKEPTFVYTVEMDVSKLLKLEPRTWDFIAELEPRRGLIDHMPCEKVSGDLIDKATGVFFSF